MRKTDYDVNICPPFNLDFVKRVLGNDLFILIFIMYIQGDLSV